MLIRDQREHNDPSYVGDWTFGTGGVGGRFGGAQPDGGVRLHSWEGHVFVTRRVKCASYRKAVRRLRQHLKGH